MEEAGASSEKQTAEDNDNQAAGEVRHSDGVAVNAAASAARVVVARCGVRFCCGEMLGH